MPSGILSEQLAVQSIVLTLGANMTGIRQLKILIHGQEAETLAGHVDLYGLFPVPSPLPAAIPSSAAAPAATPAVPSQKSPAVPGSGQSKPAASVPASPAPGKQTQH
jgi:hypothetical protein